MKRFATANWKGSGKDGVGTTTTQSGVLKNTPHSYKSRFEDGAGTNPEELIAAAHASCFTLKLSFVLNAAGFTANNIDTKCTITLDNGSIIESHLDVTATVPGIEAAKFEESVVDAKTNCPVSKLFNTSITHQAKLE